MAFLKITGHRVSAQLHHSSLTPDDPTSPGPRTTTSCVKSYAIHYNTINTSNPSLPSYPPATTHAPFNNTKEQ